MIPSKEQIKKIVYKWIQNFEEDDPEKLIQAIYDSLPDTQEMSEEMNGETINNFIKEITPENILGSFDRNFIAYKIAEHFFPKKSIKFESLDLLGHQYALDALHISLGLPISKDYSDILKYVETLKLKSIKSAEEFRSLVPKEEEFSDRRSHLILFRSGWNYCRTQVIQNAEIFFNRKD